MCKKIHRGGNAEQYHADKKYKEAVAVAVEKCVADTKGQTCYICTQALHWKTKEGLVRGCACRGTAGFVHVSCLAEQVKILMDEALENNLDDKALNERWARWYTCSLCKQRYHGLVACALGWACWKTYVGRPEGDQARRMAIGVLGSGLSDAQHNEDALTVKEAELSMKRRLGASEESILAAETNLANTYQSIGRLDQALRLRRDTYAGYVKLLGEEHAHTLLTGNNYANCLFELRRFEEAKSLLRKTMPVARRALGDGAETTLRLRWNYSRTLFKDDGATLDNYREAVHTLEEIEPTARRVLGGSYPLALWIARDLRSARHLLSAESPD